MKHTYTIKWNDQGKHGWDDAPMSITRKRVAQSLRAARSRKRGNIFKGELGYYISDCGVHYFRE